jgi:hypothetical protein
VLGQVTEKFRDAVKAMAEQQQIPIYQFDHKERKDDVANRIRQQRGVRDGIVFIGVAQEKAQAFQGKKINGRFEYTRDKTVYVNHYYFYIDDADFGPVFLKVCSYAPWGTKLCLNGHEWAKRQLAKKRIAYEALDSGFLSCADPNRLQQICDSLGPEDIDRLFRKWLKRLPLPLRPQDRAAGYDWSLSIWQMEVSLTQIIRPALARARVFRGDYSRQSGSGAARSGAIGLRPGGDQENARGVLGLASSRKECIRACISSTRTSI